MTNKARKAEKLSDMHMKLILAYKNVSLEAKDPIQPIVIQILYALDAVSPDKKPELFEHILKDIETRTKSILKFIKDEKDV